MSRSRAGRPRDQRLNTQVFTNQVGELAQGSATQESEEAEAKP